MNDDIRKQNYRYLLVIIEIKVYPLKRKKKFNQIVICFKIKKKIRLIYKKYDIVVFNITLI